MKKCACYDPVVFGHIKPCPDWQGRPRWTNMYEETSGEILADPSQEAWLARILSRAS